KAVGLLSSQESLSDADAEHLIPLAEADLGDALGYEIRERLLVGFAKSEHARREAFRRIVERNSHCESPELFSWGRAFGPEDLEWLCNLATHHPPTSHWIFHIALNIAYGRDTAGE